MAWKKCNKQESLGELPAEVAKLQGVQYGLFSQLIMEKAKQQFNKHGPTVADWHMCVCSWSVSW